MAFEQPTTQQASQDLGKILDGAQKEQQEGASDKLRNEILLGVGALAVGTALVLTRGRIGEGLGSFFSEESALGRSQLKLADRLGSNEASLKLARFFGSHADYAQEEKFVLNAASRGSGEAQFRMSQIMYNRDMHFGSQPTPRLMEQFWKYTEVAAHNGHPGGQLNYAYRLGTELGNEPLSMKYLTMASDAKYPRAMAELGKVYEAGNPGTNLQPDFAKAEELYTAAAASGDRVGRQQLARFLEKKPLTDADWSFSLRHGPAPARGLQSEVQATVLRTPMDVSNPDLLAGIRDTANNKVPGAPGEAGLGDDGKKLVSHIPGDSAT